MPERQTDRPNAVAVAAHQQGVHFILSKKREVLTKSPPLLLRRDMPSLVSNILSEYRTPAAWSFSPSSAVVWGRRGGERGRERREREEGERGI